MRRRTSHRLAVLVSPIPWHRKCISDAVRNEYWMIHHETTARNVARTGRIGDGKILVINLERAVRIRTGETGIEAV